jgi:hypothetical protein
MAAMTFVEFSHAEETLYNAGENKFELESPDHSSTRLDSPQKRPCLQLVM